MCLSFIIFNFWELIFGLKRDCHFRFRFQFRLPALHLIFAQTSVGGIEYAKYQMLSVYCPDIYILCLVRFWVWNDRNQLKTGQPRRSKNFQQISTVDQLCAVVFQWLWFLASKKRENIIPLRRLKVVILAEIAIFRRIGFFLENQPFLSTLCTLKIRRIGRSSSRNWQEESAASKLPLLAV